MKHFGNSKAFSVLELLVVITIIGIITGIGLAVLSHSGRQFGFQAIRGEIVSMIRYTRSNAMAQKGTATVVIDPNKKRIFSSVRRTVGLWHFEDINGNISTGAFGNNATLHNEANIWSPGKVGNGLMITSTGYAECGSIPIAIENQGIAIECWISPTIILTIATQKTIIDITNGGIMIDLDGTITISYGSLATTTPPAIIPTDRWSYIAMFYEPDYTVSDGSGTLSLFINNIFSGSIKGNPSVSPGKWKFNIGSPTDTFNGMVDEVKSSIISETELLQLEPDIVLEADFGAGFQPLTTPVPVQFDKRGNLTTTVPLIRLTSSSTRDSFILEITSWGAVKLR